MLLCFFIAVRFLGINWSKQGNGYVWSFKQTGNINYNTNFKEIVFFFYRQSTTFFLKMDVSAISDCRFSLISAFVHLNLLRVSKFCIFKNKLMSRPQKANAPSFVLPILFNLITSNSFSTLKPWSIITRLCEMLPSKCCCCFFNLTSSSDVFINESDFSSDSWMYI